MIETLNDRIETTQEWLSDSEDQNTSFVLSQRLALYKNQLQQCRTERSTRMKDGKWN
ncbi:MAG: hypothetical protein HUJ25_00090 [Crocinitomicaceae bacterium]|nr:hypothetical protein [Crocinitomicaceae bacterium]